jgi:hypothetical protein
MRLVLSIVIMAMLGVTLAASALAEERRSGRIQTLDRDKGTLVIEESGVASTFFTTQIVGLGNAKVVEVFRDAQQPWTWREEPTSLTRVPTGTMVVVIGRKGTGGAIEAERIEIPRPED